MSFTFHCPFCNQELEAEENWIGQETACPTCSKTIKIIKNSENSVQNLHSDEISCPYCGATIKKAAKLCRFCHRELHHAVGGGATYNQPILSMCKECGSFIKTTSSRIGQSMTCPMCGEDMIIAKAENRACPSCGESIKIEAKICKYCHSPLPPINAIGEKGNKIESMYSSARLQSDLVFPVPDAALRNEMSDLWKKLHLWFILGLSSLILAALTLVIFIGIPILIFSIVACVFVVIYNCKLLYRYWKYVGPKPGYTPGQMVGFMFIPFFNFYWIFEGFWKLAKKINAAGYHKVSSGLALTNCILACLSWVPYLNILVSLAMIVIFEILYRQFNQVFVGKEQ